MSLNLFKKEKHMTIHKFEYLGIPDEVTQDDTKKLNAGIAFLALESLDERDGISDKYIPEITALAERAVVTPLHNAGTTDDEIIQQCIITIEEYLKEQGV